jgi:undecaprenyl-diphosphatase
MKFDQAQYASWQTAVTNRQLLRWFVVIFGIYAVLYFFLAGLWLLYVAEYRIFVEAGIAFAIARFMITSIITFFYKKQRPYQRFGFKPIVFSWLLSWETKTPASFPSGHMAGMAAISVVLYTFNPIAGFIGLMVTALTGLSRILMGYHYPIDILVGFVIGFLSGYAVLLFG